MGHRYSTSLAVASVLLIWSGGPTTALGQSLPHTLQSPNGQLFGSFGLAVDGVGDVTGDGRADVVIGAEGENGPTGGFAGRAYVFDGAAGHVVHVLQSPAHQSGSYFGTAVAGVGDVDGGGRPDVLVGARAAVSPTGGAPAGRAFVFRGEDGALLHSLISPNAEAGGSFGGAVAAAGDIDGDGRPDLLVGAAGENTPAGLDAGRAYVFSGATGGLLQALESPTAQASALFGQSVAGVGDIDGDGHGDVAVGGVNEHAGDGVRAGLVHVFSGASGTVVRTLASPNAQQSGRFGIATAGTGDGDGDGVGDVLVGAAGEQPAGANSGRAYVFSGATGVLLRTLQSPNPAPSGFFGGAVAGTGDMNANGVADLLVGSANEETALGFGAGRAYAFDGADGTLLFAVESPNGQNSGSFGIAVASAGDADGDGRPDLVIGAMGEDTPAGNFAGRAYVLPAPVPVSTAPDPSDAGLRLEVVPNPALGAVSISLVLPRAGTVRITVLDALGREVARPGDGYRSAGSHQVELAPLPAGSYLVRIVTEEGRASTRMVVLR